MTFPADLPPPAPTAASVASTTAAPQPRWAWVGVQQQTITWPEQLRDALGAALGILITGGLGWLLLGGAGGALWLVAPMGASAVLLFAVPSSPLAQPWPVLVGHIVAATAGTAAYQLLGSGVAGAAAAVGLALLAMFPLRCVHPPGGGTALLAVLGSPAVHALGWGFALLPVALNALVLILVARLYRRLTGHWGPGAHAQAPRHAQTSQPVSGPVPMERSPQHAVAAPLVRTGLTQADLDRALRELDELVDVDRDTLELLLRRLLAQARVD